MYIRVSTSRSIQVCLISTGIAYIGHLLRAQVLWENTVGIWLMTYLQDEHIILQEAADET